MSKSDVDRRVRIALLRKASGAQQDTRWGEQFGLPRRRSVEPVSARHGHGSAVPRRLWEILPTYGPFLAYFLQFTLLRKWNKKDPAAKSYSDLALAPVIEAEQEDLEMFDHSDAAKAAVAKAKSQVKSQARARVVAAE